MVTQKEENLDRIKIVARKFGPFLDDVVFLGGSTVGLLITDKGSPDVRPTMDVDVIVGIKTTREYHKFSESLCALGFIQSIEDKHICRWRVEGIIVDVMPTNKKALDFSNRWYKTAMDTAKKYKIEEGLKIRLISTSCFLATKIDAYGDRGEGDYLMSKDIEDIICVVNGREEIVEEIKKSPPEVRRFISKKIKKFLKDPQFIEDIYGFLASDEESQDRFNIIEERLKRISN